MRPVFPTLVLVGVASLGATAIVQAQSARFGIGAGLTAPTSDFGSLDKAGWHVLGKVDFKIPMSPVSVRLDGLYGQTSHDAVYSTDGNTKLIGGLANVVWTLPVTAPMVKPYLLAGGGVYNVKTKAPSLGVDTSETKFAFGAGVGASFGAGPVHFFVEGRYVSVRQSDFSRNFLPVTAGVTFGSSK